MNETLQSHLIVAIARAKGCGGGSIGMEVARRLGCRYLDREILVEAARRMSRDPEALEAFDERCMSFWERTMVLALGSPGAPVTPPPLTLDDRDLFHIEKAIMKEAAQRGPVVIVGRMGFAVLHGEPGLLSVFLHAPLEERVQSMMRAMGIASEEEAKNLALRTERDRDEFVKTYTGKVRLDAKNYHLCIDTARFETDAVVGLICQAARDIPRPRRPRGDRAPLKTALVRLAKDQRKVPMRKRALPLSKVYRLLEPASLPCAESRERQSCLQLSGTRFPGRGTRGSRRTVATRE